MKTYKALLNQTQDTLELKGLVEVYEELAARHMQAVRKEIMAGREFYDGLARLSDEVGTDFKAGTEPGKKRCASVLVSANAGLYGDIVDKTFGLFLQQGANGSTDLFVIGKTGEKLMQQYASNLKYTPLTFSDEVVDELQFNKIMQQLLAYKKIFVYYGKFKNLVVQLPTVSQISGDILPKTQDSWEKLFKKHFSYLYEPSLESISQIFAQEILVLVFSQTLREGQLAKFASRLSSLEEAVDRINITLTNLSLAKRKARKALQEKKQGTMMAGVLSRE